MDPVGGESERDEFPSGRGGPKNEVMVATPEHICCRGAYGLNFLKHRAGGQNLNFVPNPTATSCVLRLATLVLLYRREIGSFSMKELFFGDLSYQMGLKIRCQGQAEIQPTEACLIPLYDCS